MIPVVTAISTVMLALAFAYAARTDKRRYLRNCVSYTNRQTGETFVWLYDDDPRSMRACIQHLGVTASDPELPAFDFMAADALARIVLRKHGIREDAA